MPESNLSFFGRLSVAFGSFFAILGDGELAANVRGLREGTLPAAAPVATPTPAAAPVAKPEPKPEVKPEPKPAAPAPSVVKESTPEAALQLLGLLQRNARFIDFVEEDIKNYSDADIGAAARIVHEGCRATLRDHFTIRPVRSEAEGARITLAPGFDAAAVRLTGNVVGEAPFTGSLTHRGWRVEDVKLPQLVKTHDARIVAPAEVEL